MLIGIDVGTTSVKAALFDEAGTALRQFGKSYPTSRPEPGHVEQNPDDWMRLVLEAISELSEGVAITAVGLCSQVNTHVFVDQTGTALLPAFTWQDTRCAKIAAELDATIAIEDKIQWWGAPLPIDASHVLARMAYVAREKSEVWARTHHVLAPKDYCLLKLTGHAIADPMTNFGILDQKLEIIEPLVARVPGAHARMPKIKGFTQIAGLIRDGLPCAGRPIVTGAMDAWSGLLGAGVSRDGEGLYLSGTSEILGLVSTTRIPTPGVITFAECEGINLHAGPTQSGGASAQWVARLLGVAVSDLAPLAEKAELAHVPLFLPHIEGERAPIWDSDAKGSFTGLNSRTGPAELARSVLEGVAYSARLVFDSLETSAGRRAEIIHHSGGGASPDLWCQIRADSLKRNLKRTCMRDAGVLGAALMAGVGCGLFPSLITATRDFIQFDHLFESDPAASARHEDRYLAYQLAYQQLKPLNKFFK